MNGKQPAYPQQHEPWRPDYPQVWNMVICGSSMDSVFVADIKRPKTSALLCKNLNAFSAARNAINKAKKS